MAIAGDIAMVNSSEDVFLTRVGNDLRTLREAGGLSQQAVADLFGWQRDAISKVERGERNLTVYDYLRLLRFFRDVAPDHPALALAERYLLIRRRH
jgi:transcriptional regulator with XRE-family HTH domain